MWTPKTCCGCLRLKKGSIIWAIIYLIIMIVSVFFAGAKVGTVTKHDNYLLNDDDKNLFAVSILSLLYLIFMALLCVAFIWAVTALKLGYRRSNIVLVWLVMMTIWVVETFIMLIILTAVYAPKVESWVWIVTLIICLIFIGILSYGLLVVFGYWRELKQKIRARDERRNSERGVTS